MRTLRDGLSVSDVGLGCMGMSTFYGRADDADAIRAIERALELGVTLFDTADMYGDGHNERLVGRALARRRGDVVIATKFGYVRAADGGLGYNARPEYVRRACEASLSRLRTDYIDLYQLHRLDPATPIEETVGAMQELVNGGLVRYLGLSEVDEEHLRRAAATAAIATLQSEYSLLERTVENSILPTCEELRIGFLAFAPLMRGVIARRFEHVSELDETDTRRQGRYPRLAGRNFEHNRELAMVVWQLAEQLGVSAAQVALAWLLQRSAFVVPIPGAKRASRIEENWSAAEVVLPDRVIKALDSIVGPGGAAVGDRLPRSRS